MRERRWQRPPKRMGGGKVKRTRKLVSQRGKRGMDEKEPAINTKDYRESKEKNKAIIVEVKKLIMVKEQFLKENIGVSLFCHGGEI
jgi:hypothetical protein